MYEHLLPEGLKVLGHLARMFKTNVDGSQQEWTIYVTKDEEDDRVYLQAVYGMVGGKLQVSTKEVFPKNVGKSNETSKEAQGWSEAESIWNKKRKGGYLKEGETDDNEIPFPQLALPLDKAIRRLVLPAFHQPKLEGIRCLAYKPEEGTIGLYSRERLKFLTMHHLYETLNHLMLVGEIWDGELYIHDSDFPFQLLESLVSKEQPLSNRVDYWVFDMIAPGTFGRRMATLTERFEAADAETDTIDGADMSVYTLTGAAVNLVSTGILKSKGDIDDQREDYENRGFEGLIIRQDEEYQAGYRTPAIIKSKTMQDAEYIIVAIEEGRGKMKGFPVFTCTTPDGETFEASPEGERNEKLAYILTHREQFIGKPLTVRYQRLTVRGVPYLPVAVAVRDYE